MITDLTDPRCNPKTLFKKFKMYLKTCGIIPHRDKKFNASKVMIWLTKIKNNTPEAITMEESCQIFPKLISCWEQCGFIEPHETQMVNYSSPWNKVVVYKEWKIVTRRKQ
jgi:hypothetical protein